MPALELESQTSADWRGFADWIIVGNELRASEHVPRYHFGDHNIDTTYPGSPIGRAGIEDLHYAAITSQAAWEAKAAQVWGAWWTATVAACDQEGIQRTDPSHVVNCSRIHYRGPVTLT